MQVGLLRAARAATRRSMVVAARGRRSPPRTRPRPAERPAPKPSRWPRDGSALDLLDKRLSSPIFTLQLGLVLETACSFPGCLFGMPSFGVPGALGLALAISGARDVRAWLITGCLLVVLMANFVAALFLDLKHAKRLYSPLTVRGSFTHSPRGHLPEALGGENGFALARSRSTISGVVT